MENKRKHLEMIQAVINRQAGNCFLIKGWVITIALAGFSLFANSGERLFLMLVVFSAVIFWILDAYYLKQEKLFRKLYEKIADSLTRRRSKTPEIFSMDTREFRGEVSSIAKLMFYFPTVLVYVAVLIISLILYII